ncbi:hypothetical protein WOLCODRAFT_23474, partial [Wolfiporia cocos MD-104 SS10]
MQSRLLMMLVVLLGLALFVMASPVPNEEAIVKRALKQYRPMKRDGVTPVKRDGEWPKPSKWYSNGATPVKRDGEWPKPSKWYSSEKRALHVA